MLVQQNHIKPQNPSLPHPTDTLSVSEPQEEMQFKRNEELLKLKRLSGPIWSNVVVNRTGNTRITQPQLASHLRREQWPLSGKPCGAVHTLKLIYKHLLFAPKQAIDT